MKRLGKIKEWYLNKKAVASVALVTVASSSAFAEGENNTDIKTLWGKLGLDLKTFFGDVFDALSSPIGVVLCVIFVMAIFYLVVRMSTRSISPSRRV